MGPAPLTAEPTPSPPPPHTRQPVVRTAYSPEPKRVALLRVSSSERVTGLAGFQAQN